MSNSSQPSVITTPGISDAFDIQGKLHLYVPTPPKYIIENNKNKYLKIQLIS